MQTGGQGHISMIKKAPLHPPWDQTNLSAIITALAAAAIYTGQHLLFPQHASVIWSQTSCVNNSCQPPPPILPFSALGSPLIFNQEPERQPVLLSLIFIAESSRICSESALGAADVLSCANMDAYCIFYIHSVVYGILETYLF